MKTTIGDLIDKLKNSPIDNFPSVLSNTELIPESFKEYESWSDECYTRNCILRTEKFELLLLCWEGKQVTPVHDHGGEQCWVYQLDGTIQEIRYSENDNGELIEEENMTLEQGNLSYMDDSMGFHALRNRSDNRALTLHIYAQPIDECAIFNEQQDSFETKEMEYDTTPNEAVY